MNLNSVNVLLRALGEPEPTAGERSGYLWRDVDAERILEFLDGYQTHPEARRADTRLLSRYIRRQNEQNELRSWTVLLVSSGLPDAPDLARHFDGRDVGSIERE